MAESRRLLPLLGLLMVLGGGCQSSGAPFAPTPLADPDNVRAYVYWPGQRWGEKSGQYPEVQIDGVPVGVLRYKSYLTLELPAGEREFKITGASEAAKWDAGDHAFKLDLERGEIVYVRLFVRYDQNRNSLGNGFMKYVVQFLPRREAQARGEMSGLKALAAPS